MGGSPDVTRLHLIGKEKKKENQTYWKARIIYNRRLPVEGMFSIFKRILGEYIMALKWENIMQKVRLKVALCNK